MGILALNVRILALVGSKREDREHHRSGLLWEKVRNQLASHDCTTDDVGVATEISGRGMNHKVAPHCNGLAAPRRVNVLSTTALPL